MNPCGPSPMRECAYYTCSDGSPMIIERCDGATWQLIQRPCPAVDAGPPNCTNQQSALASYVRAYKSCMTSTDCMILRAPCGQGAEFCDGSFYVNHSIDVSRWKLLAEAVSNCMMQSGGCATCDAIAPPAACVNGICRGG